MRPHNFRRARTVAAFGCSVLLAAVSVQESAYAQSDAPQYLRAKSGALVRNFPDSNGNVIAELEEGHLLRAHATSRGIPQFHEVEVAGGLPVWVYGELLQPTDVAGVLRVNATQVNMRPRPESSAASMALRTKLQRGDRVLVIERKDPALPLAKDWVKVWSPSSARAWVPVADTRAVADPGLAVQEWSSSQRSVPTKSTRAARNAAAGTGAAAGATERIEPTAPPVPKEAVEALARADRLFDAASTQPSPSADTWTEVLTAYRGILDVAPAGSATAQTAQRRAKESEARLELAAIRESLRMENERRQQDLEALAREMRERDLAKTVHWGRFQGRGWLERRLIDGERRWFLVWGGETTAEVRCSSGRYDMSVFDGFEVGVAGSTVSPPIASTLTTEALPRVLDVYRIEVISGSAARR